MLFRLGMSIDEAIREYVEIGKSVFSQISEEARSWQLEIAVGKMIQRQNGVDEVRARKMPMRVPMNSTKSRAYDIPNAFSQWILTVNCSFVCAGRKENVTKPIHFPTWNPTSRGFIRPNCTVMEAVRATCATPTIFKDVPILEEANIEPLQYTGADLRWNNPVLHVWEEAKAEFTSLNISHIVSIGTGATGIIAHGPDFSTTLKNIARDCETTYEEAAQMLRQEAPKIEFIRLNVEQGLQDMSWKEWEKFGVIKAHTEAYLQVQEVDQKLENLVTHVQGVCEFQVSVL